jgi:hypothetical protein
MHNAGWVPSDSPQDEPGPEPTAWDLLPRVLFDDLTPDEVDDLIDYVHLLKRRRQKPARTQ